MWRDCYGEKVYLCSSRPVSSSYLVRVSATLMKCGRGQSIGISWVRRSLLFVLVSWSDLVRRPRTNAGAKDRTLKNSLHKGVQKSYPQYTANKRLKYFTPLSRCNRSCAQRIATQRIFGKRHRFGQESQGLVIPHEHVRKYRTKSMIIQ